MNYNNGNYSKANFQADIKRKQAMFNRFKRRFNTTTDPQERRWLKTEATRIVTELQNWRKRWNNWNFGPCNWITANYTTTNFTCGNYPTKCRTTTCKTNKTYGRRTGNYNYGTTYRPTRTHRTNRTRTQAHRNTYVAW